VELAYGAPREHETDNELERFRAQLRAELVRRRIERQARALYNRMPRKTRRLLVHLRREQSPWYDEGLDRAMDQALRVPTSERTSVTRVTARPEFEDEPDQVRAEIEDIFSSEAEDSTATLDVRSAGDLQQIHRRARRLD
jgi:hypothetical protein